MEKPNVSSDIAQNIGTMRSIEDIKEKARIGYNRAINLTDLVGVDMRGKTNQKTVSVLMRGMIHFLDTKTFGMLCSYLKVRIHITVYAKYLLETKQYDKLKNEYRL